MSRYIDADYFQKRLQDFADWCRDGRKQGVDFVLDCPLPNTPDADVAPVIHAKWEQSYQGHDDRFTYTCSNCSYQEHDNFTKHYRFCPRCGAKMDEGAGK